MSNSCYGNNTVFKEEDINNGPSSGFTCFRRQSMSKASTLINKKGKNVPCDSGTLRCMNGSGFLTIYTQGNFINDGMYTCCIDGLCISARIYRNNEYTNSSELNEFYY